VLTALDTLLDSLAAHISRLSKRALVGLFWSCATALEPEYRAGAAHRNARNDQTLHEALTGAHRFAAFGRELVDREVLLHALEVSAPAGQSPDTVCATAAQDCWICADVAIRVLVQDDYTAGPAIEYALEPALQHASEELFGVSQVGSGPIENEQLEMILAHPSASEAVDFVQWATDYLANRPSPSEDELNLVADRATALATRS
jgi:hypothetical protein